VESTGLPEPELKSRKAVLHGIAEKSILGQFPITRPTRHLQCLCIRRFRRNQPGSSSPKITSHGAAIGRVLTVRGTIYLSALVETGKTYNIELELLVDVFSPDTAPPTVAPDVAHPLANFEQDPVTSDPLGLTWTNVMSITVGTDFQSNIQALQNEITQLRADLDTLRQEFKTHTHVYLTGKGVGQNNTKANSGPPNF
jgi:hypothetical protein